MDERQFGLSALVLDNRRSRRAAIKSVLGIGAVIVAGDVRHDTDAARRGYAGSNASVGAGFSVAILDGEIPGTLEYRIIPSSLVTERAVIFYNGTSSVLELEVIPTDASAWQGPLQSHSSLFIRIQHPGIVRFRAWHPGQQPGEFFKVDLAD